MWLCALRCVSERERQSCVCSRGGLQEFSEQALGSVLDLVVPGPVGLSVPFLCRADVQAASCRLQRRALGGTKIRLCLLMIVKTCSYDNTALQLRFRTSFKRFQVTYSVTFRVINYG